MNHTLAGLGQRVFGRTKVHTVDMEQGQPQPSATPLEPQIHIDHQGRPEIAADDQLNLFRHLTGITSHPSMVHAHVEDGGRAAPNLGIYARVVHNEQDAKRGYKYFSWLINSCLGLQIVVAASLTAMGAAGASHAAVTVFGAINTVIAGVLTFLKGSGLPNRLKYYQAEWKRIREFIEQRERDFGRPGCDLDVYGVVAMVEKMYAEVKADLEASVPDRFAGFRTTRKGTDQVEPETNTPSLLLPRIRTDGLTEKFKELESGFGSRLKDLTSEIDLEAKDVTQVAVRDIQQRTKTVSDDANRELRQQTERVEGFESSFIGKLKDLTSEIGDKVHLAREAVQYIQANTKNDATGSGTGALSYTEPVGHT